MITSTGSERRVTPPMGAVVSLAGSEGAPPAASPLLAMVVFVL
jgi:hypothetical protein